MEDVVCNSAAPPKKSSTTLSMDRAAFLLLRVKKAFKRKRQQRKDKQAQAIIAAAHTHQTRAARKVPPPLLRSRTLPAIIVPGLPVVSFHTDKTQLHFDENIAATKSTNRAEPRWSLLTRNTATATICYSNNNNNNNTNYTNFNNNTLSVKSLNLPKDDVTLAYRRKSSGSTPHSVGITPTANYYPDGGRTPDTAVAASSHAANTTITTATTLVRTPSTLDDLACYGADGSVLLRIPVPEVVAAHAYRMTRPGGSDSFSNNHVDSNVVGTTPTFDASHHLTTWSDFNTSKFDLLCENKINSSSTSASSSTATISNSNSSNLALTRRFAKLLHQSSGSMGIKSQQQQQQQQPTEHIQPLRTVKLDNTDNNFSTLLTASTCYNDEAPRRLSWERRKDSSALQRSASIDSFAEIVWSDSPQPALEVPKSMVAPFSKRPSASSLYSTCSSTAQSIQVNVNYISGAGLDLSGGNSGNGTSIASSSGNNRRESLLSPSATRRNKLTRVVNDNVQQLKPSPRTSAPLQADSFLCSSNNNNNKINNNSNDNNNNNNNNNNTTHFYDTDNNYEIVSLRKTHHTCNPSTASVPSHSSIEYTPPILQPQQNQPTNYHHRIPHENTVPSACNNNYTIINRFNDTDQHSKNRDNPTYYVESGVNSINCHISSPVQDNTHENGKAFNLSEQLKQENVKTVAKLRNAISCHSQYAKEMEYLLPPQNQQKQQHTHNHNHNNNHKYNHYHYHHCQRYTRHQQLHQEHMQTQTQQKEQHQHSCHSIDSEKLFNDNKSKTNMLATTSSSTTTTTITSATTQNNNNKSKILSSSTSSTRHTTKFNQFHQTAAKFELNGIGVGGAGSGASVGTGAGAGMGDEENTDSSNISSLAIYRQPANVRHKGGNTPYRSKMSKKQLKLAQAQLDKLTQCNLHLHALFSAVEHGHLDKACTILESTDVNVNSINTDGLSPLDIAVLSNNRSITKMLLQHGALEGSQLDSLGTKLNSLLKEAESHIQDLNGFEGTCQSTYTTRSSISSIIIGNTSSSVTGCTGNEIDKQIGVWERRIKGLRRLILGWDQARPPDAPASVIVDVLGDNTVQVQILEPFDGAIGTKFRVQWSTRADFSNVVGERELMDWRNFHGTMGTQYQINGLTQGRRYFIRASCGNVKGWGAYKNSVPASIIPSSWRDLNNREDRFLGRQHLLDNLFTAVRLARPADVSELTLESQGGNQKRIPKKKTTIKQLFSVASKFQKHLRRGIHLASIVYCDDKVLVTSEDFLPVIEIDESYPSSLYNDYHWLMKVACSWEDVKSLRSDMERNLTSANHFRIKLLSAVCQMQSALGFIDLGQLYYKPLKDSHGTIAIACIHNVKNQKSVSILNSRWLPVNKLQKKLVGLFEEYNISEILVSSLSDQIKYHQAALKTLGPGLYLGYLKMQCSMDQIQVVVPLKTPNVLPHYKVRDNNHINAEEWLILKRYSNSRDGPLVMDHCNYSPLGISLDLNTETDSNETTEAQRLFLYDLSNATQKLLHYMDVTPEEAGSHRLYDLEVIEHSKDISFLIICPAVQLSCAVPGQPEMLLQRDDLVPISVQAFEMIHLLTYQPLIMQKYARLSCILELDTALANQSQREAFASSELQTAKERLAKLQELTNSLNSVWKTVRWLMDAIVFARDKNAPTSSSIKQILEFAQNCTETPERSSQFLQPPMRDVKFHKSGTGRGSWPGPASNATNETTSKHLRPEHSKSEQNLGLGPNPTLTTSSHIKSPAQNTQSTLTTGITSSFLHISNDCTPMDVVLRKSSVDSVSSQYNQRQFYSAIDSSQEINSTTNKAFNMPLSRSDDTISEVVKRNSGMQRKCPSGSTVANPMKTVPGSKSVPHLEMDSSAKQGSSHSLTSEFGMEFNENKKLASCSNEKIKSASSVSLREGGVSLKTTLSSLPTEMRTAIPITIGERGPSTLRRNLERESSNVEFTAISCPTLSSEQSGATASGIIQVYTAYNTGLASGTSLKLHVTAKTSARDIINLVVKQLNMATALKGSKGPIYSAEMMNNFCLVAVIGARERCLRDDFKPLLLQNPWRKGRLYVRQKHELLAAIEHSSRKSQLT